MEVRYCDLRDVDIASARIIAAEEPGYRRVRWLFGRDSVASGGLIWPLRVIVARGSDEQEQLIRRIRAIRGRIDGDPWRWS